MLDSLSLCNWNSNPTVSRSRSYSRIQIQYYCWSLVFRLYDILNAHRIASFFSQERSLWGIWKKWSSYSTNDWTTWIFSEKFFKEVFQIPKIFYEQWKTEKNSCSSAETNEGFYNGRVHCCLMIDLATKKKRHANWSLLWFQYSIAFLKSEWPLTKCCITHG